jgi:hypothetical protein
MVMGLGLGVTVFGFKVYSLGLRILGLMGLRFTVQGLGLGKLLDLNAWGKGCWV